MNRFRFTAKHFLMICIGVVASISLCGCSSIADGFIQVLEQQMVMEQANQNEIQIVEEAPDYVNQGEIVAFSEDGDPIYSFENGETINNSDGLVDRTNPNYVEYRFRSKKLLDQHYEKHGIEMGFDSKEDYQSAASDVINNPEALTKTEKEDGDYVYYVEDTNEFVILSTDGYIRTYFNPNAGRKYFDRQ